MKKTIALALLATFSWGGQELYKLNCTSCHLNDRPQTPQERQSMIAPPITGIMFHLSEEFDSKEAIKNHIVEFSLNPTYETAICESIDRFGIMPSMEGIVNKEELGLIANWLIEEMTPTKEEYEAQRQDRR